MKYLPFLFLFGFLMGFVASCDQAAAPEVRALVNGPGELPPPCEDVPITGRGCPGTDEHLLTCVDWRGPVADCSVTVYQAEGVEFPAVCVEACP